MQEPAFDIGRLSADARLRLIEELWESLRTDDRSLPLSEGHRRELDRRLRENGGDASGGIPWDEVLRRIQGRTT